MKSFRHVRNDCRALAVSVVESTVRDIQRYAPQYNPDRERMVDELSAKLMRQRFARSKNGR